MESDMCYENKRDPVMVAQLQERDRQIIILNEKIKELEEKIKELKKDNSKKGVSK